MGGKDKWSKGGGFKKKSKIFPEKTVWVGDLPDGCTLKELKELGDQCGDCKWAEVYKFKGKNTGAIGFASAEAALTAVGSLNGALIGGQSISCDSWEKMKK